MNRPAENPQRILIVRPSALGDVARTVPALVSLKRAFPAADIDWLVQDSFAQVIAHHPDLHQAIAFPRKDLRAAVRMCFALHRHRYDRVYDLQGLLRSGLFTAATLAPRRIGAGDAREMAWLGYTKRIAVDPANVHTVDRMLAIIEADGVPIVRDMRLHVSVPDKQWARQFMADHGLEAERFAVIAPTARWASKAWPAERYDQIAERLGEVGMEAAVIVAAKNERDAAALLVNETSKRKVRRIDLIGKTSIGQLMAILSRAGLVLANDSAALHIAIGLERRVVSVFGPTDPAKVGPYRYDIGTVCAEPGQRLHYRSTSDPSVIASVSAERVWRAVTEVMRSDPPRGLPQPAPAA
ncbi:MAG: hypothetical protein GC162_09760 [Planctomycetes bacterium]|nr:hypothetical protein [Planctomycetota bacterium]